MKKNNAKQPSNDWSKLQQEVKEMIKRYGDSANFVSIFTVELQLSVASSWRRAYIGTAPTLACMLAGYGKEAVIAWLTQHINSINNFSGVRRQLTMKEILELSSVIVHNYHYLKASELLLFFSRFRCCNYGRFYGKADPMIVTDALKAFLKERREDLHSISIEEKRNRPRTDDKDDTPRFSLDEWLQLRKERGDTRPLQGLAYFLSNLNAMDDDRKAREAFRRDNDDFTIDDDDFLTGCDDDDYNPNYDDDEDYEACYA